MRMMQLVLRWLLRLLWGAVLVKVRIIVAVVEAWSSRWIVVLRLLGILLLLLLLLLELLLWLLLVGNGVLDGRHMAVTALIVAPERHVGGNTGTRVRQWVGRPRSKGGAKRMSMNETRYADDGLSKS